MRSRARFLNFLIAALVAVELLVPTVARAEIMSAEGLDQTLAPIALYPDGLLGNVLVGATYPDQVVEAAQWRRSNSRVPQDQLESKLSGYSWDASVKALVAVPEVLDMMANDMDWTVRLGTAFVDQTDDVYDSIQRLRTQAQGTGALVDTEQVDVVTDDSGYVMIGSTDPNYLYVPAYEPAAVYGWNPGAVVATTALVWGTTAVLNEIFYGSCFNWHNHGMYFGAGYGGCGYWGGSVNNFGNVNNININNNFNKNVRNNIGNNINRGNQNWKPGSAGGGGRWSGNNGYGDRNRPAQTPAGGRNDGLGNRNDGLGGRNDGLGNRNDGPGGRNDRPGAGNRPSTGDRPGAATRPSAGNRPSSGNRPSFQPPWSAGGGASGQRPGASGQRPGASGQRPSTQPAFQRPGSGSQTRQASQRGRQSRQSSPSFGSGRSAGGGGGARAGGGGRSGGGGARSGGGGGRGGRR